MARDPRHDILFEPVPIGPKTLRNRFYQSPHCTSFGAELPGSQAHIRAMKAEGGWAAVNTEFCSVHPSSDSRPLVSARLWDDDDARNLGRMAELAHEHGALAGVELWHGGCVAGNLESRLPARSVSQMSDDGLYATSCYELDKTGIREIQGYFVAAARRARDVGFDMINIEGAECGALTQHFLMSKFNRRTDEYGGSLENRARFWLEIVEQVREAVGDDCAITARLCVDTLNDNPLGIRAAEEAYEFIELGDHLVDFWDLQAGGWAAAEWAGDDAVASRFAGEFSHRQADRRRRALHQPRHHGRRHPLRRHRHHRRRAPLDRRSLPAAEDRTGPLRRDPRVHRLQHLRLALRHRCADRVHPERHARRGVPPRLAP